MAELPKKVSIDFELIISDRNANKLIELLSDYMDAHWEKAIVENLITSKNDDGTENIRRVFRIEDKER